MRHSTLVLTWCGVWLALFALVCAASAAAEEPMDSRQAVLDSFRTWALSQGGSGTNERMRVMSVEEAVEMAKTRKEIMRTMMLEEPERALKEAFAVPLNLRRVLDAEVQEHMEEVFDARGSIHEVEPLWTPETSDEQRAAWREKYVAILEDGTEWDILPYGRRAGLSMPGGTTTGLHGVVMRNERVAAVLDSPMRRLQAHEVTMYRREGRTEVMQSRATANPVFVLNEHGHVASYGTQSELDEEEKRILTREVHGRALVSYTNGVKSMLWIRIAFPDLAYSYSLSSVQTMRDTVNSYYATVSNSSTSFSQWTIPPVITMSKNSDQYTGGCNDGYKGIDTEARQLSAQAGYDVTNYDRWLISWQKITAWGNCWAGLAYVGAKGGWINTNPTGWDVVSHELGHNWGFRHANAWVPGASSSDPADPSGSLRAYYDKFDVMGYGGGKVVEMHFNVYNKIRGNWFADSAIQDIDQSGTYRIYAMDINSLTQTPRALAYPKDSNRKVLIEFRQAIEPSSVAYNAKNGVFIKWIQTGATNTYGKTHESALLDMRPWTSDQRDAILGLGDQYIDGSNGLSKTVVVTPVRIVPNEYVDVVINVGDFPGNRDPSVDGLQVAYSRVPRNVPVPMRAKASDADSDTLSYYWDYDFSATALSQYFGDKNAEYTSHEYTSTGTQTVQVTVSDMRGGANAGSVQVTVTSSCPDSCNNHGTCVSGKCQCDSEYTGPDCSLAMPTILSTQPAGVASGGTITINGRNFTENNFVRCNYTNGDSFWATVLSSTQITCPTMPRQVGLEEEVTVSPDTLVYAGTVKYTYDPNSVPGSTPAPTPTPTGSPGPGSNANSDNTAASGANPGAAPLSPEASGAVAGGIIGFVIVAAAVGWAIKVNRDGGSVRSKLHMDNLFSRSGSRAGGRAGGAGAGTNVNRIQRPGGAASSGSASRYMPGGAAAGAVGAGTVASRVQAANARSGPPGRAPPPPVPQRLPQSRALYAYSAQSNSELSISEGDMLTVKQRNGDGWALVVNQRGQEGYVPNNYITA